MSNIIYRPLKLFPVRETMYRGRSKFKTVFARTLRELAYEIGKLGAEAGVLEIDVPAEHFKRDGMPYLNAVYGPRVVLSCDSDYGPLRYPCDTYDNWKDNVRAIALSLQNLRAVDRYGVTRRGEQYTGWKALPSSTAPTMTTEYAAGVLSALSPYTDDMIIAEKKSAREAVRAARSKTHPDRQNGSRADWDAVDAAASILSSHHGVSL